MKMPDHIFTNNEIIKLNKYRDKQKNANLKIRFVALLMISKEISIDVISQTIGKCKNTIIIWFVKYLSKGIDSLNSYNYVPKKEFINKVQISEVLDWVRENNPSTCKEVARKIKDDYSVMYTAESVRKLLKRNGMKFSLPKVIPGNPPTEEKQKKVVDKYNKMKESCEEGTVFLFGDGMHLLHQNIPSYCWIDPKDPPVNKTNTGRKRLNILGAYNPDTFSLIHLTGEENCNASRVIEFFFLILSTYKNAPKIIIYLDNAMYFKAKIVSKWLEENPRFEVVFLPPYCPNLNLIERLWRFVKDKLVKNTYYKKYISFRSKTFQLLNSISEHKNKLKTLMVEKFEIVKYAEVVPEKT
jgi:transposase